MQGFGVKLQTNTRSYNSDDNNWCSLQVNAIDVDVAFSNKYPIFLYCKFGRDGWLKLHRKS